MSLLASGRKGLHSFCFKLDFWTRHIIILSLGRTIITGFLFILNDIINICETTIPCAKTPLFDHNLNLSVWSSPSPPPPRSSLLFLFYLRRPLLSILHLPFLYFPSARSLITFQSMLWNSLVTFSGFHCLGLLKKDGTTFLCLQTYFFLPPWSPIVKIQSFCVQL